MTKHIYCDMVIARRRAARLHTVLNLPKNLHVLMTYKEDMDTCDFMLARKGICVLRGEDNYESYFEDIMKADHYENRKGNVGLMIRINPGIIQYLLELEVGLDKNPNGSLKYTKGGAHSRPRICFHENITGKAITTALQEQTATLTSMNIVEYTVMTDILTANGACAGILTRTGDGSTLSIHTRDTVMATGGVEELYRHSTNFPCLTGDVLIVARKHGVKLEHLDYVQIHPTSSYAEKSDRSFLISESARDRGAVLPNGKGERPVNELLPRGTVSQTIGAEMEREGSEYVWLFLALMPRGTVWEHFPHIYETCLEEDCDITREPIPVVLAQRYFMDGMRVNLGSRTTIEHLYAVDETGCSGAHGKNHLVSNNLLESPVSVEKAAKRIESNQKGGTNCESNYYTACY